LVFRPRIGTHSCWFYDDLEILIYFYRYTVTKSEPNEASLWKITLQKRENSHVCTGTFIPPLTQFLNILLCGKSIPGYGWGHFTGLRR
jgi:hypothetical protein